MPPAEATDDAYPLRLTTGRLRDQWHSMTRTGLVARLFSHSPEPEVLLHKESLQGIGDGSLVRVTSRRGSVVLKARASDELRPGDAFIAMHWGGRFMGGVGTNALTLPAIDPHSKQPELKHAAVRVEPFVAQWRGVFSTPATPGLQTKAAALLPRFDYAALSLVEGQETLVRVEVASAGEPDKDAVSALEELFGQATESTASGRAVCACFNVAESQIRDAVAAGASLARLQKDLKCGTNCGSCVPELRRLALA